MKKSIPPELREELQTQERMRSCVVESEDCSGRLEWHHAVQYGGESLQVWWAIHAICHGHHLIADRPDMRERIVKVIHLLGGEEVEQYEKVVKLK